MNSLSKNNFIFFIFILLIYGCNTQAPEVQVQVTRLGVIIDSKINNGIPNNIQGPSLIRTPNWLKNKLGNYYLYFADHKGQVIQLAYSDEIEGPYKLFKKGTLTIENSGFLTEQLDRPINYQD